MPAAFVVTTASDVVNGSDGVLSLREAITQANANTDSDTITFDASLNGTEIDLTGGQMTISENVTITGNGAANTIIDAQQASRIFTVDGTGGTKAVTISSLTLKNGSVTGSGGAIVNRENLTISNCTLSGNSATGDGGVVDTNATVSFIGCTITGNSAVNGGVSATNGSVSFSNCTVSNNSATSSGGVTIGNGTYTFSGSTFSSNTASGGGVIGGNGTYTATDCTFSGNSSTGSGGVVSINSEFTATGCLFANNSAVNGGALAGTGDYSLTNSTFSGNSATDSGAAIFSNSSVTMTNCTVANNRSDSDGNGASFGGAVAMFQSAAVTLKNTIIAGNFVGTGSTASDLSGSAASGSSYNIIGHSGSAGGLANGINGNQIGVSPLLGSLANNGGASMTHALLTGSPAINAGSNALVPGGLTTDQRGSGFSRVFATFVDIGAFESQTFAQQVVISPDDTFTNAATITFSFQFNYDVTGFTASDVTVTNGTKGTFSAVDARNYTLVVTPVADGAVVASLASNVVNEGNPTASATVNSDHVAPTLAISPNGTSTRFGITFTFQFSEAVTGFSTADITLSQGSFGSFTTVDADTYELFVSSSGLSNGPVTITVGSSTVTDLAGNANATGGTATVTFDNVAPTVAITPNSGNTNTSPILFTFQFNEAVTGFVTSDVTVVNGTKGTFTEVDSDTYTLEVTPTNDGTVTATVGANSTTDAAGNNIASTSASVTSERNVPSLAINSNPAATNGSAVTLTLQFTEPVTGFGTSDVTIGNATKGTFTAVDADTYTLVVTPTGTSNITVDVAANTAQDLFANANTAASATITFDNTAPTLEITPNGTSTRSSIFFSFQFSEVVTGFTAADVTLSQGTLGTLTTSDGGKTYTAIVSSSGLTNGPVNVSVASNSVQDLAANANTSGASASVTFDTVAPTVTITPNSGSTNANPIVFTFEFSEAVTGFTVIDVTVTNGTKGTLTAVDVDTYTLNVTPTADGTVTASIASSRFSDTAGNSNSGTTSASVTSDRSAPGLTITPNSGTTNANPITFTFQFTETVTGFDASDITIANGTKGTFTAVDGDTYTLLVTPTANGTVTASVGANAAQDALTNGNAATSASVTSDISVPTLAITPNGTTSNASTLTFTFQFSQTVTGFATGDVTVTNGTKGTFSAVDGDTYTLVVTPTADGAVTVDVGANAAVNSASTGNPAASATVTSDRTAPSFTSSATINANENQTSVVTVTTTDVSSVTYSLNGGADAAKFSISSGGVLTFVAAPNRESPTDSGTNNVYDVIVKATDAAGNTSSQNIAVTVADVNEFDPVLNDATFSIVENSANSTAIGTVTATDADATKTLAYSITGGNTLGIFAINSATGAITVADNTKLDREQISSVVLTVQVTDGGPGTPRTDTAAVTVNITGVNDNSPVFTTSNAISVAENTTAVGTVIATDADLPAQTVTYTITGGADSAKFSLTTGGVLTFKTAPNFESPTDVGANNVYEVIVTANDGSGRTTPRTINVTVTNASEFAPVLNDTTFSIAENSANNTTVGTLAATDGDGTNTFTYSITAGNSLGIFAINASTGAITVASNTNLDREQIASVVLTIQVSDGGPGTPLTDTAAITINVSGVNDNSPVFTSSNSVNVPETKTFVTTVTASDADLLAQTLAYSITGGADQSKFGITTGGVLSFVTAPSFASPTDADTNNVYEVSVTASDNNGHTTSQTINVTVTEIPVYELLVIRINSATSVTVERTLEGNTTTETLTGSTALLLDDFATAVDFELPATNDAGVTFADVTGADGLMRFTGTNLRTVTFNVTHATSFLVHGNGGNDAIRISSLDAAFNASIELQGDAGNDTLDVSALSRTSKLVGGLGNDVLKGGTGNDTLIGNDGNDSLTGGTGTDVVVETLSGVVTLSGSALKATTGNDALSGIEQVSLTGGSSADKFDANAAPATMSVTLIGNGGNDILIGGAANDRLDGGANDDSLVGNAGNDLLNGDEDNDSLTGGAGLDSLFGGNGTDRVIETGNFNFTLTNASLLSGNGTDSLDSIDAASLTGGASANTLNVSAFTKGSTTLLGGGGNDTLIGSNAGDVLNGETGDDSITGNDGDDVINGGAGNDKLFGGNDDDSLTGDAGNDSFDGGSGTDRVVEIGNVNFVITAAGLTGNGTDTLVADTVNGGSTIEEASLTGGVGNNTLTVNGFVGSVTLNGAAGNDTLTGGTKNDSINGGDGIDQLILNNVTNITLTNATLHDTTLGGAGLDGLASIEQAKITITLSASNSVIDAGTFSGAISITGSNGDDDITTGAGNDSILGGLGNDDLHGNGGLDTIDGGTGNDCIRGDAGNDRLLGGAGNDTIQGGSGDDSIDGGADDDVLLGDAGNDTLIGGTGDLATDPLGSRGDDILSGGDGNDSLSGGDGADTIIGGAGTDRLSGGNGNDILSGDADKDTLAGDAGTDTLFGGADALVDSLASGEANNQELTFSDSTFFTHLDELLAACD